MNENQQCIAIAEVCGAVWQSDNFGNRMLVDVSKDSVLFIDVHGGFKIGLPDYLNDLNAMREAEKVLTDRHRTDYEGKPGYPENLASVIGINYDSYDGIVDYFSLLHATASQRAEAFLKCLGLWKK
jgi:hypothetical protein